MSVKEALSVDRVSVVSDAGAIADKPAALRAASELLARGLNGRSAPASEILRALLEREATASTGVGGGVAVPHAMLAAVDRQIAALVVLSRPFPFDSIDGEPVAIVFALVGPPGAAAQHLKALARIARLLRDESFRKRLRRSASSSAAYELICELDR